MIKIRFARYGDKIVDAFEEVKLGKRKRYDCIICKEQHPVHLVQANHIRYHRPGWFAHNGDTGSHGGGDNTDAHGHGGVGESETHMHAKFLLQKHVGRYFFCQKRCPRCFVGEHVYTSACTVKIEENDQTAAYRYDAMLHDSAGAVAVMEVWHKSETKKRKIAHVRVRGLKYAEFDASEVIKALEKIEKLPPHQNVELPNIKLLYDYCDTCTHTLHWSRERNDVLLFERWYNFHYEECTDEIVANMKHEILRERSKKRFLCRIKQKLMCIRIQRAWRQFAKKNNTIRRLLRIKRKMMRIRIQRAWRKFSKKRNTIKRLLSLQTAARDIAKYIQSHQAKIAFRDFKRKIEWQEISSTAMELIMTKVRKSENRMQKRRHNSKPKTGKWVRCRYCQCFAKSNEFFSVDREMFSSQELMDIAADQFSAVKICKHCIGLCYLCFSKTIIYDLACRSSAVCRCCAEEDYLWECTNLASRRLEKITYNHH